jgi:hypothetical protein
LSAGYLTAEQFSTVTSMPPTMSTGDPVASALSEGTLSIDGASFTESTMGTTSYHDVEFLCSVCFHW